VVNWNQGLVRAVAKVTGTQNIFEDRANLAEYVNALRPQHWLKNLLVCVPIVAAHRSNEAALLNNTLLAFVAFCCFASGGYLFNDVLDLSADSRHPTKCLRSFVSGRLPLSYALVMVPTLFALGCALAMLVSQMLVGMLLLYFTLTLIYSLLLKKVVLLDVIVLAGLYTLRIMTGAVAIGSWPSEWLFVFSALLFLSLALVKRYSELVVMRSVDGDHARARSYELSDAELLASMGIASGYMAVLVLALYITSNEVKEYYGKLGVMWFLCPLLLYWVSHVWLMAHRGRVNEDPITFALRNRTSRILIALMLGTAVVAIRILQ
jgi:4-hydroxybenzoate polyprenyltransferase